LVRPWARAAIPSADAWPGTCSAAGVDKAASSRTYRLLGLGRG
jgi:hypothetical protein